MPKAGHVEQPEGPEASGLSPWLLVERATLHFSASTSSSFKWAAVRMVRDSIYQRLGPHPGSQQPLSCHFLPLSLVRKSSPLKIRAEPRAKHVNGSISLHPGNTSVQRVPLASPLHR